MASRAVGGAADASRGEAVEGCVGEDVVVPHPVSIRTRGSSPPVRDIGRFYFSATSYPEPIFQRSHPIARDGQLGFLFVLQPDQYAAVDRGKQFLHEADVDDRRAMD